MGTDGIAEQQFKFGVVRRVCDGVEDLDRCLTDADAVLSSWRPGINFLLAGSGVEKEPVIMHSGMAQTRRDAALRRCSVVVHASSCASTCSVKASTFLS